MQEIKDARQDISSTFQTPLPSFKKLPQNQLTVNTNQKKHVINQS